MSKKLPAFFLLASSLLLSCAANGGEDSPTMSSPTMDDVSFQENPSSSFPLPGEVSLPQDGDKAIDALPSLPELSYFDNLTLHELPGQWTGYGIHYPGILRHNGHYYLYESTPDTNIGIRCLVSENLVQWEFADEAGYPLGYVTKDRSTYASKAPRAYFHDDAFYLYFNSASGYQVFVSSSPEGPFLPHAKLNFASAYQGSLFQAPNGKLFFLSGGVNGISVYEMKSPTEIDLSSKAAIPASEASLHRGEGMAADSPTMVDVNGTCYLFYSSEKENFVSYRTYALGNCGADYSSATSLAKGFRKKDGAPILLNTDEEDGARGLGDVMVVPSPDGTSHYAIYTSYENATTRRLNIAPVSFSGGNVSIVHRDERQIAPTEIAHRLPKGMTGLVLSEKINGPYSAHFSFDSMEEVYFSYKSSKNTYALRFLDSKAVLLAIENGLENVLGETAVAGNHHEVDVKCADALDVCIDGIRLTRGAAPRWTEGKIGYQMKAESSYSSTAWSEIQGQTVLPAEKDVYPSSYLKEESSLGQSAVETLDSPSSPFHGSEIIKLQGQKDFARFLIDVPKAGRYGLELTMDGYFAEHGSALGARVGNNPEFICRPSPTGTMGPMRSIIAEFDLGQGVNEVLIENLAGEALSFYSFRLVEVLNSLPSFSNPLSDYCESGVTYRTDFKINEAYESHATYEGARSFAYVGDNRVTDFSLTVEIAFAGGLTTTGFVAIGWHADDFASSSIDTDESMRGYYLELSQFQTKLMKHGYGSGVTMGIKDLANSPGDFLPYTITMKGNRITVMREDYEIFSVVDPLAYTSGRLAFGSSDCNGLIRNLSIQGAN